MIDPDLIQQYYSQLSNQDLINFTKNEGNRLTDEAINYLFDEYVRRGLDLSPLEKMVEAKEEIKAAAQVDNTTWNYALNAKKFGKTDEEILQELTAKEIGVQEAESIINRLPNFEYENERFEDLIESKSEGNSLGGILGVLGMFGFGAYFLYLGVMYKFFLPVLMGLVLVIMGIYFLRKQDKAYKGKDYWVNVLKEHPEKIVWIKPIVTKHTIGFVFTLFRDHKYQLLTTDEQHVVLGINSDIERQVFFNGIRQYLPHAHIGYTPEIDALYTANPESFITLLQERQIYRPLDSFNIEVEEEDAQVLRHSH